MWYEDMFTYEGIPMTAPTRAGMKGAHDWKYDREQMKREYERNDDEEPAVLTGSSPVSIQPFQNTGMLG